MTGVSVDVPRPAGTHDSEPSLGGAESGSTAGAGGAITMLA